MIFYVNDNHRSIWHRLSHFHSVIKFLFNLGVRFNYIYILKVIKKLSHIFYSSTRHAFSAFDVNVGGVTGVIIVLSIDLIFAQTK